LSGLGSVYPIVMWALVFTDLAETYSEWEKLNRHYEDSYDKFRLAMSIAGPFAVGLFLWAETLRRHAQAADRCNLPEEAAALRQSAGNPHTV